jgi:hypothetical protein
VSLALLMGILYFSSGSGGGSAALRACLWNLWALSFFPHQPWVRARPSNSNDAVAGLSRKSALAPRPASFEQKVPLAPERNTLIELVWLGDFTPAVSQGA